jgi:hypothetical protein
MQNKTILWRGVDGKVNKKITWDQHKKRHAQTQRTGASQNSLLSNGRHARKTKAHY